MHNYLKVVILSLTLLFLLSCSLFSVPGTPVANNTPTGAVELQSPTPSPSPTQRMPTDMPAPASLNTNGPYIVFKGQGGIWITNPDGSFPTQVSEYEIQSDLRHAISPTGDRMALVVENDQGLDLVIVKIPSGETETIAHLIRFTRAEESGSPTSPKAFATYAIRDNPDVAWQPGEGRLLAFTGAINGSTSDLYLYDTQTHETKQLTSGLSQSISPIWSPDGQYILNYGVSWVPPFGGAIGPANRLDGVWAVRVSDGNTRYDPPVYDVSYLPTLSKNGYQAWEVLENQKGRVVVKVPGNEWQTILNASVEQLIWDPLEGRTLLIASQDGSLYAVSYPDFTLREMGKIGSIDQTIWVP